MILDLAQRGCDCLFELRHYPQPGSDRARPLTVAHRGAWSSSVAENTLPAFREAARLGAWGIELDVRFCRDGVAVVNHDPDLRRCYGRGEQVCDLDSCDLPGSLCRLADVLSVPGVHFFIEIKEKLNADQVRELQRLLGGLRVGKDYHFLALDPSLVHQAFLPSAWILVGEVNLAPFVRESLHRGLGGVAGHYLGMTTKLIDELHSEGQKAGTGFVPSKNIFYREWARGVDFVFTNHIALIV